jgi:uncharacterized protein YebE (UPF0316 family)
MTIVLDVLLIVGLRLIDVSLGTLRIMLLTRGSRWRAGAIGFFESLTWVMAAGLVLSELDDPVRMVAFAFGFGAGTFLGASLERLLAVGNAVVHIVAPVDSPPAAFELRRSGFGATVLNGEGMDGEVRMTFTVVPRRRVKEVLAAVRRANPQAFVTVEDVRTAETAPRTATAVRK